MQLIRIPYRIADILDRQTGRFQKLLCLVHPVSDQKFLGADAHMLPEDLAQVVPMDLAGFRDPCNGDIILKILRNIAERPFQIIGAHPAAGRRGPGRGGAHQAVDEHVQVGQQVKRRFRGMVRDIQHGFLQLGGINLFRGPIYRIVDRKPGQHERLLCVHAVKFDPGIFPGMLLIGGIGGDLPRYDQEALVAADMVRMVRSVLIRSLQSPAA